MKHDEPIEISYFFTHKRSFSKIGDQKFNDLTRDTKFMLGD